MTNVQNWIFRLSFIAVLGLNLFFAQRTFERPIWLFSLVLLGILFGYFERQIQVYGQVYPLSGEKLDLSFFERQGEQEEKEEQVLQFTQEMEKSYDDLMEEESKERTRTRPENSKPPFKGGDELEDEEVEEDDESGKPPFK